MALGIRRETVHAWRKDDDKQEFSNIVEEILAEQAKRLLEKGMSGDYNASIAKLLLSKHGYVEKSETKTEVKITDDTKEKSTEELLKLANADNSAAS